MQFFVTEEDLEKRLAILSMTSNYLSDAEVLQLCDTFEDSSSTGRFRQLRDQLIPYIAPDKRTEVYALAVAFLSSEINATEQNSNCHYISDPSGVHVNPSCVKALLSYENLNRRLEILNEQSWTCLFPNGSPTVLSISHPEISELLYDSALALQNTGVAKSLARSLFRNCGTMEEQVNFIDNLMSSFSSFDEMQAFAADLLISSQTNRNLRLPMFEIICSLHPKTYPTFVDHLIENFGDIMPEPYFDEHIVRFLKAVSNRFSFDSARQIALIANQINIDLGIELGCEVRKYPNKPFIGISHDSKNLGRTLSAHLATLQAQIIDQSKTFFD